MRVEVVEPEPEQEPVDGAAGVAAIVVRVIEDAVIWAFDLSTLGERADARRVAVGSAAGHKRLRPPSSARDQIRNRH